MRCFFWGTNNRPDRDTRGAGITSFAIPDWGVQFRAAQFGNATECEYGALLALLAFIEENPKVFEGVKCGLAVLPAPCPQAGIRFPVTDVDKSHLFNGHDVFTS